MSDILDRAFLWLTTVLPFLLSLTWNLCFIFFVVFASFCGFLGTHVCIFGGKVEVKQRRAFLFKRKSKAFHYFCKKNVFFDGSDSQSCWNLILGCLTYLIIYVTCSSPVVFSVWSLPESAGFPWITALRSYLVSQLILNISSSLVILF